MAETERVLICQVCKPKTDEEKFFLRMQGGYPLRTIHTKVHCEFLAEQINSGFTSGRTLGGVEVEKFIPHFETITF